MTDRDRALAAIQALSPDCSIHQVLRVVRDLQAGGDWFAFVARCFASAVAIVVTLISMSIVADARKPVGIAAASVLTPGMWFVALFWAVGPALWFLWEYNYIWKRRGGDLEEFKYGHELAKAVWAGIGTMLISLFAFGSK